MMLRRISLGIAGAAMSMLAPLAVAQVPPAMDRAPNSALMVGAIKNLERFNTQVRAMAETLAIPPGAMGQLDEMAQLLRTPGVNATGSAAFVVLPGADEDDQNMVMILPVTDVQAMVRGLGGQAGPGVNEVEIEGKTLFIKGLDGGFAAAGEDRGVVEAFAGAPGATANFERMLGTSGRNLAQRSDVFFIANVPALAPRLREGMEGFAQQAQMMAMMAGGAQQPNFKAMEEMANDFIRDAQSAVLGFSVADQGLGLGFAAQFSEGSQMANYFQAKGNAAQLLNTLPNQPFLVALAMDTSSPGMKQLFKRLGAMNPDAPPGLGPVQITRMIDQVDGQAFFWGTTPALMGGLFLNTVSYTRTKDPAALVRETRDALTSLNRKTVEGITFQTAFQEGGAKVGERAVDTWTMKMQADPTHPQGQQIAQMQMMMFGPTGLSGYMVPVENGVIMTYSKNQALLQQTLASAQQGQDGLGRDAGITRVGEQLPSDRSISAYIGIRNIMEVALGFMGMMGGGPANFEVPQDLPPIGFGAVTSAGGVHGQIFVPMSVIQTIRQLADQMRGGGDFDDDFDDDAGQDEF